MAVFDRKAVIVVSVILCSFGSPVESVVSCADHIYNCENTRDDSIQKANETQAEICLAWRKYVLCLETTKMNCNGQSQQAIIDSIDTFNGRIAASCLTNLAMDITCTDKIYNCKVRREKALAKANTECYPRIGYFHCLDMTRILGCKNNIDIQISLDYYANYMNENCSGVGHECSQKLYICQENHDNYMDQDAKDGNSVNCSAWTEFNRCIVLVRPYCGPDEQKYIKNEEYERIQAEACDAAIIRYSVYLMIFVTLVETVMV